MAEDEEPVHHSLSASLVLKACLASCCEDKKKRALRARFAFNIPA